MQSSWNFLFTHITKGTTLLAKHLASAHGINFRETIEDEDSSRDSQAPMRHSAANIARRTDLLFRWMVDRSIPFAMVDTKSFKEFAYIMDPRYVVPCRQTMSTKVDQEFQSISKAVHKFVESGTFGVSITSDGWTSVAKEPYLSITGHFIDNDWCLRELLLDFKKFPHPHTAINYSDVIREVCI